jgi:hypothetical protein
MFVCMYVCMYVCALVYCRQQDVSHRAMMSPQSAVSHTPHPPALGTSPDTIHAPAFSDLNGCRAIGSGLSPKDTHRSSLQHHTSPQVRAVVKKWEEVTMKWLTDEDKKPVLEELDK